MRPNPIQTIVHCFRSPVGGIFRHVRDLALAQEKMGYRVGVVCDDDTGGDLEERNLADLAGRLSLPIRRVPMQRHIGPHDLTAFLHTHCAFCDLEPDVIHGHGAKGGALGRVLGTMGRIQGCDPLRFYTPHGGSLHYDRRSVTGKIVLGMEGALTRICDGLLFVSDYEKRTFFDKVGRPACPHQLVYNGLAPGEFRSVPLDSDATDFLFVGMLRDLKGPDLFIQALAQLPVGPSDRPPSATIVGDGPDRENLKALTERLGMTDRVRFREPMPIGEALRLGRHIVIPSRAEALPYTVLEVLAAGRTLLATRVGGIPEILGAASPALMDPTIESIASTMQALIDDPARFASDMPRLATLRERFDADRMAADITAFYAAQKDAPRSSERSDPLPSALSKLS